MKLVLIFGPQAVGKMTVGQGRKITGLKTFIIIRQMNWYPIFFSYGSKRRKKD